LPYSISLVPPLNLPFGFSWTLKRRLGEVLLPRCLLKGHLSSLSCAGFFPVTPFRLRQSPGWPTTTSVFFPEDFFCCSHPFVCRGVPFFSPSCHPPQPRTFPFLSGRSRTCPFVLIRLTGAARPLRFHAVVIFLPPHDSALFSDVPQQGRPPA